MTVHFSDLAKQAGTAGGVSSDDIRELRSSVWEDGHVGRVEADTLFLANDDLRGCSREWGNFFVEALFEHVVNSTDPRGGVDVAGASWLWSRVSQNGKVSGVEELELLTRILQRAEPVANTLKAQTLGAIEKAVTEAVGPTRNGDDVPAGCITDEEVHFLRRMVYRTDRNHPRAVGRSEAETLFRIKEATRDGDNSKDWPALFVQGVGTYLQSFGGDEPLSPEQVAELQSFMEMDGTNLAGFLQRMFEAQAVGGVREQLRVAGELDPLERALMEFLAN